MSIISISAPAAIIYEKMVKDYAKAQNIHYSPKTKPKNPN